MGALVFDYSEYKDFLNAKLTGTWGEISRAAQAAGCQRSYLSRVITGPVHLTPDHAFKLSSYWKMNSLETDYFLALLELSRAGTKEYRLHMGQKLKRIRTEHENLSKRFERVRVEPGEKEFTYYSSWYWSAIHILVSIPEYQTVDSISKRLSLSEAVVLNTLEVLQKFQLVRQQGKRWVFSSPEIHVPKDSPLVSFHHNNWRQRAVLHSQDSNRDGIHYTIVQSMSHSAFEKIKQALLEFITESSQIGGPSKEEELVCIGCDLFQV